MYSFLDISFFLFFACGVQRTDVGSTFPGQGLNTGHGYESPESEPLDHQGTPFWTHSSWKTNSFYLSIQLARKNCRNESHFWLIIIF